MYEDAEGRRITIYLCAADLRAGEAVRTARSGKATALLWRGDGLVWAMVGEIDRDGLEQLAHQVQSELAG
jgi:anti-sigma factor RsiW